MQEVWSDTTPQLVSSLARTDSSTWMVNHHLGLREELPVWSFRLILKPDSMLPSFEITPLTDMAVVSRVVLHIFLTPVHVLNFLGHML